MWYITEQLTAKFPNIPFLGFEGAEMQVWIGDQVEAYRKNHEQTSGGHQVGWSVCRSVVRTASGGRPHLGNL